MILKNTTTNEIRVQIFGKEYVLVGNTKNPETGETIQGEVRVPDKVGEYWKTKLHNFLEVHADTQEDVTETNDDNQGEDDNVDLDVLSRKELDAVAAQFGIDPIEFKNKTDLKEAILAKSKE